MALNYSFVYRIFSWCAKGIITLQIIFSAAPISVRRGYYLQKTSDNNFSGVIKMPVIYANNDPSPFVNSGVMTMPAMDTNEP